MVWSLLQDRLCGASVTYLGAHDRTGCDPQGRAGDERYTSSMPPPRRKNPAEPDPEEPQRVTEPDRESELIDVLGRIADHLDQQAERDSQEQAQPAWRTAKLQPDRTTDDYLGGLEGGIDGVIGVLESILRQLESIDGHLQSIDGDLSERISSPLERAIERLEEGVDRLSEQDNERSFDSVTAAVEQVRDAVQDLPQYIA